jgi:acyl transferase domain-containing protein/phosphopantetheinyl transferase
MDRLDQPRSRDVAIIGMACLFPGARDLRAYWQNIVSGVDAIGDPPEDWDADLFYDPAPAENDRTYCKRGGYLGDLATFNPLKYGVMPNSVEGEPDQFLAVRIAHDALADAGYLERLADRERVEVVIGRGTYINRGFTTVVQHGFVVDQVLRILKQLHPSHTDDELRALKRELKASLPPFNAEIAPGLVPNLVSGRIANRLDLMGPNYTVDAACASSHIAVERGVEDLRRGSCDLAIVGGVHASTPAPILIIFSQLGALSRTGRLRPFSRHADGTLLGEGLGLVVLKRLEEAERDGDRIYAVIKGVGVASDGRALGLLAPRVEGEELALRRAYAQADVSPETVSLVEAHGTGTPVGDSAEIQALRRVFGERQPGALPRCALGSVKSMISHLIPAAGIAGIIKTALALHHKVLPPTLYSDDPDPKLELEKTPFYLNTETRPWIHGGETPRRAGVNAFGFGGINAHAILEEHVGGDEATQPALHGDWPTEVVIVESDSRHGLRSELKRLARSLDGTAEPRLRDVARTCNSQRGQGDCRVGIVASSILDLRRKLEHASERLEDPRCSRIRDVSGIYFTGQPLVHSGSLAFVFPGEGSQYQNMLSDLCVHFPQVRGWFDLIDRAFRNHSRQLTPSQVIFPPPGSSAASDRRHAERRLWQMDCGAEAVFTASQALLQLLGDLGLRPAAVVGHSTGEYSALIASGMTPLDDRLRLIRDITGLNALYERFVATERVPEGVLLTVGGIDRETIASWLRNDTDLHQAMDNCPHQVVLFGSPSSVDRVVDAVRGLGGLSSRLPFNRAYHTPLFATFCDKLQTFFERLPMVAPSVPIYSCATAEVYPSDPAAARQLAISQWARPVRFRETILAMYEAGIRLFVEVGPRNVLTAFIDDILGRKPHLAVPSNVAHRTGITQLHHLIAQLAIHGVSLDTTPLYRRRDALDLRSLDSADRPVHDTASIKLPTGLQPLRLRNPERWTPADAMPSRPEPIDAASAASGSKRAHSSPPPMPFAVPTVVSSMSSEFAPDVMRSHLSTMQRFLGVQQEIMEAFLGCRTGDGAGVAAPVSPQPEMPRPVAPVEHSPVQTPQTIAPAARPVAVDLQRLLVELVSERTGYPSESIGLGLDLEADLGIDSIKRVEIIGALQQRTPETRSATLEALSGLRTLEQILAALRQDALATTLPVPPAPDGSTPSQARSAGIEPLAALPLIGSISAFTRGLELVATRTFEINEDLFLRDHTLGRQVSSVDERLTGLPIVPLTMTIEMLAEAAAALMPGTVVVGLRNLRAYRWIALDRGRVTVQVSARSRDDGLIDVRVTEMNPLSTDPSSVVPFAEGTVVVRHEYEDAPPPLSSLDERARPSSFVPGRLYADIMFHGPRFQGVRSMDRWGERGAEATLHGLPGDDIFRSVAAPTFQSDPMILDAAGQVVAYWIAEGFDRAFHIFPYRVAELRLFGPRVGPGESATCRVAIESIDDWHVRSNLDILTSDGTVRMRVIGWEDRRFDLPDRFFRLRVEPASTFVTRPWTPANFASVPVGSCRLVDGLSHEFLQAHDHIWERVLAHLVLSAGERQAWDELHRPAADRLDWLLGRIAAKDAVRDLLKVRDGLDLPAADVEIASDEHGRPVVARVAGRAAEDICVSISHANETAAAIAVSNGPRGIGIDIEHRRKPERSFTTVAMNVGDQALLARLDEADRDEWTLRLWCAKQAVAKALGAGMVDGCGLTATAIDSATGLVSMTVSGGLARGAAGARHLHASTFRDGELIASICVDTRS